MLRLRRRYATTAFTGLCPAAAGVAATHAFLFCYAFSVPQHTAVHGSSRDHLAPYLLTRWLGGVKAGCRTYDREVVGSTPARVRYQVITRLPG